MKRWMTLGAAMTLALTVTACGNDNTANKTANNANTGRDNSAVGTAGTANNTLAEDRDFIREHLAMGESEIALGQMAAQKATHPEVKRFAQMMVRDHQMAGDELKQISSKLPADSDANNTAKTDARDDHKDAVDDLKDVSGRDFDKKYIDRMIDDHEKAVNDLERKAGNGSTEVRQWASTTLPKVQQHLDQAKTLKETLDKAGNK
jgi:putative membrane protein